MLCGIPSCTLFRGVQLKSYLKHHVTTLCGSVCTSTPLHVELFICLLHFRASISSQGIQESKQSNGFFFKVGICSKKGKVARSGKRSLT